MYRNAARPGSHASSVRSPATLERSGAYSATGQGLTIAAPKQWASFLVQSTTGAKLRVCIDSLLLSCHLRVPCCSQCFTGCSNCPCERTHIIAERCRCHNDAYVGCTAPVHLSRMEVQNDGGQHPEMLASSVQMADLKVTMKGAAKVDHEVKGAHL